MCQSVVATMESRCVFRRVLAMLFVLWTRKSGKAKNWKGYAKQTSCLAPATLPVAAGSDSLSSTEQTSTDHDVNRATPRPDISEELCTLTKRTRTDTGRWHSPVLKGMPTCSTTTQTLPSTKSYYLWKHPASSMTPDEEKIATCALKRKLESLFDGQTAIFKTRGQSLNPCQSHALRSYLHLSLISWISILRLDSWCGME